MTFADALWFITCEWHETVTTLYWRSPAPKPYAHTALVENWSVWAVAGKLDGRKEVKEQWDQAHWDEGWCVHVPTAVAWDDYISALAKTLGLSGRKEGDPQLVHALLVCYTNNSDFITGYCTKDHSCVKYQAQGSLVDVQKIIMLMVTIWNYWAISLLFEPFNLYPSLAFQKSLKAVSFFPVIYWDCTKCSLKLKQFALSE